MSRRSKIYDLDELRDPYLSEYWQALALLRVNRAEAVGRLEGLARRGSLMSVLFIADCLRDGWFYAQDLEKAERWYAPAVAAESTRGLLGLGLTHVLMGREGEGVRELELASSRNFPPAMNALAVVYFSGRGVEVDRLKAFQLWLLAARLGHYPSKLNILKRVGRGHYGFKGVIVSLWVVCTLFWEFPFVLARSPVTDRMR